MRSNEELLSLGWEGSGLGSEQQGIKGPSKEDRFDRNRTNTREWE